MKIKLELVKNAFGKRLKQFREVAELSQLEYADFIGTDQSYITAVENGRKSIQLETMQQHALAFGVNYFQLGNPEYPIPTLTQMPAAIRRASANAAKARAKKAEEKAAAKEAGENVYKTGTAAELHALVVKDFFNTPRTSREAYAELNPGVDVKKLTSAQRTGIAKITGTLSKGKFAKLLDKLEPVPNTTAVRFVIRGEQKKP